MAVTPLHQPPECPLGLLYESIERAGTPHEAVENLPRFARAAGFEVTAMSGFVSVLPPDVGLQIAMANLAAVRERAQLLGVATEQQLDEAMRGLSAAMKAKDSYDWIASPLIFDLAFKRSGSAR